VAASSPTFGPQWPERNPNIVTLTRRDGLRLPLHRELVHLVSMLMDLTENMGYDIKPGQTWGYANRAISGTRQPSNHSRGCAIDINAPSNPYASVAWHTANATARPFGLARRTDIPQKVFELWERHGFSLGVKYPTKPDPMHFEFTQTVTECRRITQRLATSMDAKPPAPKPPQPPEDDVKSHIIKGDSKNEWYITDGIVKRYINDQHEAAGLVYVGLAIWNNGKPFVWEQPIVDDLTVMPRGKTLT